MIEIRDIVEPDEFEACIDLQRSVWGFSDPDVVTAPMLATCRQYGGIVKGAFESGHGMLGFVFSFPALLGNRVVQHSHMLAVLENRRDTGLGTGLKVAQLRAAREMGCEVITWTFDPLESRNAYLNLNKLGVRIRRYYVNLYGESSSSTLHSGLGTDRFLAEWYTEPVFEPTSGRIDLQEALNFPQAISAEVGEGGWPEPLRLKADLESDSLFVEVPADTQLLKEQNMNLALAWREATRSVLSKYLQNGYEVMGLAVAPADTVPSLRSFYRIERV
jgi:predicted GNAT superfamily acetyltransferase